MTDQDKIITFLRSNGPSLPSKIAKFLNTEILFASAHLSDLKAQGKIKISNIKIGGSPLYYLQGQEHQLEKFAAGNINPKDLAVLQNLKEKKVLREAELDLLSKVALRSLQDFAIPLHVTINGKKELFWKWHLVPKPETNDFIDLMMGTVTPEIPAPLPAAEKTVMPIVEKKPEIVPEPRLSTPKSAFAPAQTTLPTAAEKPKEERLVEKPIAEKQSEKSSLEKKSSKRGRKKSSVEGKAEDTFFAKVETHFGNLKIIVEQKEIIRKNAEINSIVKVPSAVGHMLYFCKAKQKAKCDEKDVSAAYMEAQIKKLPLLFLYTGELSKKAVEMLQTEAFQNAVVKRIE
jgi:hypothetical protein